MGCLSTAWSVISRGVGDVNYENAPVSYKMANPAINKQTKKEKNRERVG